MEWYHLPAECLPSTTIEFGEVYGNMERYDDGLEWHPKVGYTKKEYGLYQGAKIMRLCHPICDGHKHFPTAPMPGIEGGFDVDKWPIPGSSKVEGQLASKLMRWPHMPGVITQVCSYLCSRDIVDNS